METCSFFSVKDQCVSSLLLYVIELRRGRHRSSTADISTALSYSCSSLLRLRTLTCAHRRLWDSNAESFSSRSSSFDSNSKRNNSKHEDDDYATSDVDQWLDVLEEFIDGVYMYKAFKSFGWLSPIVFVSWLTATGPKAFLVALGLSLGHSALSLVFQKLSGKTINNRRRNIKTKKKPNNRTARKVAYGREENQRSRKRKEGYQSWVSSNNVAADRDGQTSHDFGGWDELDEEMEISMRSNGSTQGASDPSRIQSLEYGKLNRAGRKSETPLLLRLLIATFPFLSSWTKML